MSQPAVEAIQVSKCFDSTVAVADVSLKVAPGEFFSLLGPSGCGKTTLLRMIAGFEEPSAGRIIIAGQDMTGVAAHKRPVNLVFQSYALFPHLSVFDNVAFGLRSSGRVARADIPARVRSALELVRLEKASDQFPARLSGGQQQRVALARAIVNNPQVLLLDEPLSALDLKIRQEMQAELARLQLRLGMTFVMVTHDQQEALALSNRMAVFHRGRLEQVGSPEEIFEQPGTAFVADFIGQTNLLAAAVVERSGTFLKVEVKGAVSLWVKDNPAVGAHVGQEVTVWARSQDIGVIDWERQGGQSAAGALASVGEDSGSGSWPVDGNEPINRMEAVVSHSSYRGTSWEYELTVQAALNLRASVKASEGRRFVRGERVFALLPARLLSVLPASGPDEVALMP